MINFMAVALATMMIPASVNVQYSQIKTPNGKDVEIAIVEEGDLSNMDNSDAILVDYFSYVDKEDYETYDSDCYVELKRRGTYKFNNFAYAFYLYWGGDIECIIEKEEAKTYLSDLSFEEVKTPQSDDIVCYYSGNNLVHAGIVKNVLNKAVNREPGSNLIVESKWEASGLFQHRGDLCPYIYKYSEKFQNIESADNVRYYTKHAHNYTYEYTYQTEKAHYSHCKCKNVVSEPHRWIRLSGRQKRCELCGYVSSGLLSYDLPTLADTLNFDYNDIAFKKL